MGLANPKQVDKLKEPQSMRTLLIIAGTLALCAACSGGHSTKEDSEPAAA